MVIRLRELVVSVVMGHDVSRAVLSRRGLVQAVVNGMTAGIFRREVINNHKLRMGDI
jgi:hypothetical protein